MLYIKNVFLFLTLCFGLATHHACAKGDFIEKFGDYTQAVNPLAAFFMSSHTRHYALNYAQNFGLIQATKITGVHTRLPLCRRPKSYNYDGMVSGHTSSAWFAASYLRNHENLALSAPFYLFAGLTGYSRVHARKHTLAQVIGGALAAEISVYFNKYSPQNYKLELNQYAARTMLCAKLCF